MLQELLSILLAIVSAGLCIFFFLACLRFIGWGHALDFLCEKKTLFFVGAGTVWVRVHFSVNRGLQPGFFGH